MELFAVNGSVPAEQLEKLVQEVRQDPPHPGRFLRDVCQDGAPSPADAARILGIDLAVLEPVLAGRAGISADLAVRLEKAGWCSADLWVRMQAHYDLAQARLRAERRQLPAEQARTATTATP